MTRGKNVALAAAVAGLFALGAGAASAADAGDKVKCEGANGCKGHSACKTASNECAGQNGCKGKGFMMMTQAECDAAKAKMKEGEKPTLK
jgi:hypothetical protein